jgi:hypothetical protein
MLHCASEGPHPSKQMKLLARSREGFVQVPRLKDERWFTLS